LKIFENGMDKRLEYKDYSILLKILSKILILNIILPAAFTFLLTYFEVLLVDVFLVVE